MYLAALAVIAMIAHQGLPSPCIEDASHSRQNAEQAVQRGDFATAFAAFLKLYELTHDPTALYDAALATELVPDRPRACELYAEVIAAAPRRSIAARARDRRDRLGCVTGIDRAPPRPAPSSRFSILPAPAVPAVPAT
jgi:hypothetical protein